MKNYKPATTDLAVRKREKIANNPLNQAYVAKTVAKIEKALGRPAKIYRYGHIVIRYLEEGKTVTEACELANIPMNSIFDWLDRAKNADSDDVIDGIYVLFAQSYSRARSQIQKQKDMDTLDQAVSGMDSGNYRMHQAKVNSGCALLKLKHPDLRDNKQINVQVINQKFTGW